MRAKPSGMPAVPYGVTADGTIRFPSDVQVAEYGLRCGLSCPECGRRLEAVRRLSDDAASGIAFFRHAKTPSDGHDGADSCRGYGETSAHLAAKEVLRRSVGKAFWLPSICLSDYAPHVGTFATSTGERASYVPYVPGDDGCVPPQMPHGIVARNPTPVLVGKILIEASGVPGVPDGMRPDAVIFVRPLDETGKAKADAPEVPIAIEVRNTHAKDAEDIRKYAETGMRVIEISIGGISPEDANFEEALSRRMLGTCAGDADELREWLNNPSAMGAIGAANGRKWSLACGMQLVVRGALEVEPVCQRLCGILPDTHERAERKGGRFDAVASAEMGLLPIGSRQDDIDGGARSVRLVLSAMKTAVKATPLPDILDMLGNDTWEGAAREALSRLSDELGIDVAGKGESSDDVARAIIDRRWRERGGGRFVPTLMPGSDADVVLRTRRCAWDSRRGDWFTICRSCWRCPKSEGHWKVTIFSIHVDTGKGPVPYQYRHGELPEPVGIDSNGDAAVVTVDVVRCHARKASGEPGFFDSLDGLRRTLRKAWSLREEAEAFLADKPHVTEVSGDNARSVNKIEDLGYLR